jgi:hypothetical protein
LCWVCDKFCHSLQLYPRVVGPLSVFWS